MSQPDEPHLSIAYKSATGYRTTVAVNYFYFVTSICIELQSNNEAVTEGKIEIVCEGIVQGFNTAMVNSNDYNKYTITLSIFAVFYTPHQNNNNTAITASMFPLIC